MNSTGVFFEGWSSGCLYNTTLMPETPRLSPGFKEKYHAEKQKNTGDKVLRSGTWRWLEIRALPGQTFLHVQPQRPQRVWPQSRGEEGTNTLWVTANPALTPAYCSWPPVWSWTSHSSSSKVSLFNKQGCWHLMHWYWPAMSIIIACLQLYFTQMSSG